MEKLIELFRNKGKAHQLTPSIPFSIEKKGEVFAIDGQGPINLFADKRNEEGPRHFLASFSNCLVFNLAVSDEKNSFELLLLAEEEITLYELQLTDLEAALQDPSLISPFAFSLQNWIEQISQNVRVSRETASNETAIVPDETVDLSKKEILVAKKTGVKKQGVWIEMLKGELFLFGDQEMPIRPNEALFPLSQSFWLIANDDSSVKGVSTIALIEKKLWKEGVATFSRIFSHLLPLYIQHQEEEQKNLLNNRTTQEKEKLEIALQQLKATITPSFESVLSQTKDPLQQACLLLGHFLKIKFHFPREAFNDSLNQEQKLKLISQTSRIPMRKVTLENSWWKENHGPLLGFYGEEKKPVALLIEYENYKFVDQNHDQKITKKIAKEFSQTAYMFYVPFDTNLKTGKEIIRVLFTRYFKKWLATIIPIILLGGFYALFFPVGVKLLFSYAIPMYSYSLIDYLTLGLIFASIGISFFYLLRGFLLLKVESLSDHLITTGLWDRLLKLAPSFFRRYSVGNLFWRTSAIDEIRSLISANSSTLLIAAIFSVLYLLIMIYFSLSLTVAVLLLALLGIAVSFICSRLKIKELLSIVELEASIQGFLIQMIEGVGKLRVSGSERSAFSRWASLFSKINAAKMRVQNLQNIVTISTTVLPILSIWIIYLIILNWSNIVLSDFLAFFIAFSSFSQSIYPLCNTGINLANIAPLWSRTKVIMEEATEEPERKISPGKLAGNIKFDQIVFGYNPNRPPILKNISLSIHAKEFIGIVGRSGSGKSTLGRLLMGFEKPLSGVVFFDDKDLLSLDLQAVRRQMGVVLQTQGMMAGSIYSILVSGGTYSQEEIERALTLSSFDEDLDTFPMGLHTFLPMNGTTLSGGQKQRLQIARAIIGTPSILFFDEATSALDNQTQEKISSKIETLNVTRIIVAQRLSTISKADRIYVLDEGRIVQTGTFEELIGQKEGLFAEMAARQNL